MFEEDEVLAHISKAQRKKLGEGKQNIRKLIFPKSFLAKRIP